MTLPEDEPGDDQRADDESRPEQTAGEIDEASGDSDETATSETELSSTDAPKPDPSAVEVDTAALDQARDAIDDAREAVKKVAATDAIDADVTGASESPAFADSAAGVDEPEPSEDDTDSDGVDAREG